MASGTGQLVTKARDPRWLSTTINSLVNCSRIAAPLSLIAHQWNGEKTAEAKPKTETLPKCAFLNYVYSMGIEAKKHEEDIFAVLDYKQCSRLLYCSHAAAAPAFGFIFLGFLFLFGHLC